MFSSPRTVKAPPFIFTLETRECNGESGQEAVQGSRGEPRGGESRLLRESRRGGGRGRGGGEEGQGGGRGREGGQGEVLRGRHRHSHKEKENLMMDKFARQDDTEHPRHRKVGTEKLGGGGSSDTPEGSTNWGGGAEQERRRAEVAGATVKSQAKTPKIERHFHMYILQMYIDTIR